MTSGFTLEPRERGLRRGCFQDLNAALGWLGAGG
jgi:hypothetical protein